MFELTHITLPDFSVYILAIGPVARFEILAQRDVDTGRHFKNRSTSLNFEAAQNLNSPFLDQNVLSFAALPKTHNTIGSGAIRQLLPVGGVQIEPSAM